MERRMKLSPPLTLEPGKLYLRRVGRLNGNELLPVRFINYSASPEIIIIWNGSARERCPRWELFLPEA